MVGALVVLPAIDPFDPPAAVTRADQRFDQWSNGGRSTVVNVLGDAFGAAIVHHLAVRDAAAHAPTSPAAAGAGETRRESENE